MLRSRQSRDGVREQVAAIWAEVLAVDPAVCDDFFAAGGNSLAAVEITARTTAALGVEVSPATIFSVRSLDAYTEVVGEAREQSAPSPPRRDREALTLWEAEVWALGHYDRRLQPVGSEAITLEGRLDVEALEACLTQLVERHESLRTIFTFANHAPRARVLAARPLRLTPIPVSASGIEQALERLERAPLQLETAPPWRVSLLRVRPTTHVLFLLLHEILADGEGYGVLLRDLSRLYESQIGGVPPPRPPTHYRDAAHLPRSATRDSGRRHWSETLRDGRLTIPLPPATGGLQTAVEHLAHAAIRIPDAVDATLVSLAREVAATPFMGYLASYLLLLHRWSGESRVAVRSAAANRPLAPHQEAVGLFSRLVPIELDVGACCEFRDLLERTRTAVLDAFRYADELPVGEAIRRVRGVRRLHGGLPSFRLRDRSVEHRLHLPGIDARPRERNAMLSGRLHLDVRRPEDRRVEATLSSDAGWTSPDMKRMLGHWLELLTDAVAHPDDAWNERRHRTAVTRSKRESQRGPVALTDLVNRQITRAPEAVAIQAPGASITYAMLDERACALAATLQAAGVADGVVVKLRHEPSPQLVVAMLAVLRLGATCRVRPMSTPELVAPTPTPPYTADEALVVGVQAELDEDVASAADDKHAFVVWTAGTHNRPRAVVLTHQTLCEQALRARTAYRLGPGDQVLHLPGLGPWAWALTPWASLVAGASVVIPSSAGDASSEEGVTVVALSPRAAAPWLARLGSGNGRLRLMRLQGAGAVAVPSQCDPDVALVREYGVTEAGGVVVSERITAQPWDGTVAGTPWRSVDVCASDGVTLPAGAGGDLFLHIDDARVDTGDLAVCRPDGTVHVLGRRRDQVSFRGFRLAPAIAHLDEVLVRHPAVEAAAVVFLPEAEALVACLVGGAGVPALTSSVLDWLKRLSGPCIGPVACVTVDRIPLSPDGRPDRVALARAVQQRWEPRAKPRDSTERAMLKLWKQVLSRRDVGVEDNFFALGGTLTRGIELVSRARAAGLLISPQMLLNAPTVAELAALATPWPIPARQSVSCGGLVG